MKKILLLSSMLALASASSTKGQTANIVIPDKKQGNVGAEISVPISLDITSLGSASGVDAIDLNFTGSDPLLEIVRFELNQLELPLWQTSSPGSGLYTLFNLGSSATNDLMLGHVIVLSDVVGSYELALDFPASGNPTDVTGINPLNPTMPLHFTLGLERGIVVVPEPSGLVLLGGGTVLLFRRFRR